MSEPLSKLQDFFQTGVTWRYNKGQVLLHAGDRPFGVCLITQGYVKAYSIRNSGELNLHIIYKAGDVFPLIWAYRGTTTSVFYQAMDDVVIQSRPREEFRRFVYGDLGVAAFMQERLSEIHWIYANRVENLELARAYDKVVFRLLALADRMGQMSPSGETIIRAPITHQDIADSVNMIRETASREIAKLEKQGLVTYRDHQITIPNLEKLQQEMSRLH